MGVVLGDGVGLVVGVALLRLPLRLGLLPCLFDGAGGGGWVM